jgi:hypothetical protein
MSVRKRTWTTAKGEEWQAWLCDYTGQSGKRHVNALLHCRPDHLRQAACHPALLEEGLAITVKRETDTEHGVDRAREMRMIYANRDLLVISST